MDRRHTRRKSDGVCTIPPPSPRRSLSVQNSQRQNVVKSAEKKAHANAEEMRSRTSRSLSPEVGRHVNAQASTPQSTLTPKVSARSQPSKAPYNGAIVKQKPLKPPLNANGNAQKDKRYSTDVRRVKRQEFDKEHEATILHDEIALLREENKKMHHKLQLAEEKLEEQDARARQLENQGVETEKQTKDVKYGEIETPRLETETVRGEAIGSLQKAQEAEAKAKALQLMMQRMILTQEEKEEVVLKRCWLARYWGLAVRHGVYSEIASQRQEYWSSLAPIPVEVVMSAGFEAKKMHLNDNNAIGNEGNNIADEKHRISRSLSDLNGDVNIESLLSVEKGLRELASLKIEDAITITMAQHRRLKPVWADESFLAKRSLGSAPKFRENPDLTKEEVEDVQFKQAWLISFWGRAKIHKVEEDIADERLQYWINQSNQSSKCHDLVDVQGGLRELQRLGIERQLWEASRKEIKQDFSDSNK